MDVSTALTDYLLSIGNLGKRTQLVYRQRLLVFASWCTEQHVKLEQVNNRQVQAFLEYLRTTRKPHKQGKTQISSVTIGDYVQVIWAFLNWCLQDEDYQSHVTLARVKGIKMPRIDQIIKDTYTDKELAALFEACQSPDKPQHYQLRDTAILAVLLDTGIRNEELRTLTIGNVFLASDVQEDSYIKVMGKGRKEREIPLGNKARRILSRYIRQYRSKKGVLKTDVVFPSRHGGPIRHESLKDVLWRLKARAGLPDDAQVNPHKFRHTWARRFIEGGGDIYDLSRLMGHSSVAVTENYLKSLGVDAARKRVQGRKSVLDSL